MTRIKNRYEFVMFFDVENGNPNGDPDAGNMPRVDVESNLGIVTDVCLKRKIRNYVEIVKGGEAGYNILIKNDEALNTKFTNAYNECGINATSAKDVKQKKSDKERAKEYICANYYDVRTFGAVMKTGNNNCGVVRGPVQINFARSIDPIFPQELTITRQAMTTEERMEKNDNEMGKKNIVPYGLYKAEGYVSALLANKTGFSEEDLEILFDAIINMFEHDHSASRGKMCLRKLIVFKHDTSLGNALSHKLFELIQVEKINEGVARNYSDYSITIKENPYKGVQITVME